MGFDLHGNKPKINVPLNRDSIYGMIVSIDDVGKRWDMQDKLSKDEKTKYWEEYEEYHDNNPGIYFRNNVWWWRPLWSFITSTCDDILTEKDIVSGSYNDGRTISRAKAMKIAKRIEKLANDGSLDKYAETYDKQRKKLAESTDKDTKFFSNYPFDKDNVKRFATFCKESGGFKIC
jgi:hypothetical protein